MMKPIRIERTSANGSKLNLEALYQIAPSCFTEEKDEKTGTVKHVVNFKTLRQLLGDDAVEDSEEMYQFTWPGKQSARREAATPIADTLRPVTEDSVDWDTTQNLYIEGDNLRVLKLLQKSYMGKVKMIYIDPPYNTGNDFVYHDDFKTSLADEELAAGNIDEEGLRYRKNSDVSGRFHSDWCSMMYSRLLVARSLLTEDGVIFISIDDHEVHNLRKICDEVFGAGNFAGTITRKQSSGSKNDSGADKVVSTVDFLLVYSKGNFLFNSYKIKNTKKFPYKDEDGYFSIRALEMQGGGDTLPQRPKMGYSIYYRKETNACKLLFDYDLDRPFEQIYDPVNSELLAQGYKCYRPRKRGDMALGIWRWGDDTFIERFNKNLVYFDDERVYLKERQSDFIEKYPEALLDQFLNTQGTENLKDLEIGRYFNFPKPLTLILFLCKVGCNEDSLILDFFSGSATTAHAVMKLNAEDGGKRKYIMVQYAEDTPEKSEARKAGYKNICEIAKERIRRAGKKIKEESPLSTQHLDTGFRVFRLDGSNYEDVTKQPGEYDQRTLDLFADNIKADRTDLDLLFGAMLSWGVQLSLPMTTEEVDGCKIYTVDDGGLVACFAENITENVAKAMADKLPVRVLFRDSCFGEDKTKINIFELFKQKLNWDDKEAQDNIKVV